MKKSTKKILSHTISWCLSWLILMATFTYLWYSFGFNMHRSVLLSIILTLHVQILLETSGYLREIIEQRDLKALADKLNESKETDERLCSELEKINSCAKNEEAHKELNFYKKNMSKYF